MASTISQAQETPWTVYQAIEGNIAKRYKLLDSCGAVKHSNVSKALQRLGQAVLIRHHLTKKKSNLEKMELQARD